jgi:putative DNA methylase
LNSNDKRLIEIAFPLKQASLDSVHEKNVRHGHISTLHIWPARRPLAASRAALIATLLRDPESKEDRAQLLERLGGKVVDVIKKKRLPSGKVDEIVVPETVGGVLHWGRESGADLNWFRKKIKEEFNGRSPRVLDPFAGGGAIPLEAMRLGCETAATDVNPVAWFILKCTLDYPQRLSGQYRPLPEFAVNSPEFMEGFFKGTGKLTKKQLERNLKAVQDRLFPPPDVDLAWHLRAWGWWVLQRSKSDLAKFYPLIEGKQAVAYLWARTVKCKNCRATVPLLKTKWLCKKDNKRVLLTMEPNPDKTAVVFGVETPVPQVGGNTAQRREFDKKLGVGTMSRSGVSCPCCKAAIMTMEEIRAEGMAGRLGFTMTCMVVEADDTKQYFAPASCPVVDESAVLEEAELQLSGLSNLSIDEPMAPASTRSISCHLYGVKTYRDLFTSRQTAALANFTHSIHAAVEELTKRGYPTDWVEAIAAYLALSFDRLLSFTCVNVRWKVDAEAVVDAFARFSISLLWDFAEPNPIGDAAGSWLLCYERIGTALDTFTKFSPETEAPAVLKGSAAELPSDKPFDVIITDPPYYQAISYADLSDFFYVWLRGVYPLFPPEFQAKLTPKDKEIVQHIREDKSRSTEKTKYEEGMYEAFSKARSALADDGRFVCVFAHKDPEAWETLTSALIRSGFVVSASWPIQTEMVSRQRASQTAALASSVWMVCKKRPDTARPGWDQSVLSEMHERIQSRLREFWDAGIRGPDFVWAATGPALEIFSKHPIVKKANASGEKMDVSEFLRSVRRIVVDFIVGQVVSRSSEAEAVSGLDDVTTYYILHRYDFGFTEAPIGACILYAVSCGLTDRDLSDRYELLSRSGSGEEEDIDVDEDDAEDEGENSGGAKVKLRSWNQRHRKTLGEEVDGRPAPLIDQIHRLMQLWRAGDVNKVNDYLDARALRRNSIFGQLLQALIELSPAGSEERSILESLSNHVAARGVAYDDRQLPLSS